MLDYEEEKGTLEDSEFYILRDFIYNLCGIYFRLEKKYLIEDKIVSRMKTLNLKSANDYIYYLKYGQQKGHEMNHLYDIITINETSFFRNLPQINAFKTEILPRIIDKNSSNGNRSIRIWSAGCSTGEEPYTISIVINEVLRNSDGKWFTEVFANDINQKVLDKALSGIYGNYSLRNTEEKIIKRCFSGLPTGEFQILKTFKKNVKFQNINLLDLSRLSKMSSFDAIFCRNVLIYFDISSRRKVIQKFYELLKPGGYLFLGHSESMHGISNAFKLILFKEALAYQKE